MSQEWIKSQRTGQPVSQNSQCPRNSPCHRNSLRKKHTSGPGRAAKTGFGTTLIWGTESFSSRAMNSGFGNLSHGASCILDTRWTHGPAFLASWFTCAASTDNFSATFREELSSACSAVRFALNLPVDFFLADLILFCNGL